MRQRRDVDRHRLHIVAYQQDDLITRSQAGSVGLSAGTIRRAIGPRGKWQLVLPGIYATFTGPLGEVHRLRGAVLHGGNGAMVTGAAACRLHGLAYVPETDAIDILIPATRRRRDVGEVHVHRTGRLPDAHHWLAPNPETDEAVALIRREFDEHDPVAGDATRWLIPVAPPARAAMDAARLHYLAVHAVCRGRVPAHVRGRMIQDTRALLCEVVQRRRTAVDKVVEELDAAASAGTAVARIAMDDIVAGCRSAPECELRDLFKGSRVLPEPRWNLPLPGYQPSRKADSLTPDACLREARLVVEVDSVEWHRIGTRQEQTEKRRARYAELGWLVISVSPYRIRNEPEAVRRDIEQTYLAQIGRAVK